MELKLSFIAGINPNELANPLAPANLFGGLKDAIGKIDEFNKVKQSLYKVFEETLLNHLSPVYQSLEKILQECGAPKQMGNEIFQQGIETAKSSPDFSDEPYLGNYPEKPEGYHTALKVPQQFSGAIDDSISTFQQPGRAKHGQPIAETATNLLNIINRRNLPSLPESLPDKEFIGTGSTADSSAYSADEIVAAISKIQTKEAVSIGIHRDYSALQKHLAETLEASAGGVKQFASVDKNRIEVYAESLNPMKENKSSSKREI